MVDETGFILTQFTHEFRARAKPDTEPLPVVIVKNKTIIGIKLRTTLTSAIVGIHVVAVLEDDREKFERLVRALLEGKTTGPSPTAKQRPANLRNIAKPTSFSALRSTVAPVPTAAWSSAVTPARSRVRTRVLAHADSIATIQRPEAIRLSPPATPEELFSPMGASLSLTGSVDDNFSGSDAGGAVGWTPAKPWQRAFSSTVAITPAASSAGPTGCTPYAVELLDLFTAANGCSVAEVVHCDIAAGKGSMVVQFPKSQKRKKMHAATSRMYAIIIEEGGTHHFLAHRGINPFLLRAKTKKYVKIEPKFMADVFARLSEVGTDEATLTTPTDLILPHASASMAGVEAPIAFYSGAKRRNGAFGERSANIGSPSAKRLQAKALFADEDCPTACVDPPSDDPITLSYENYDVVRQPNATHYTTALATAFLGTRVDVARDALVGMPVIAPLPMIYSMDSEVDLDDFNAEFESCDGVLHGLQQDNAVRAAVMAITAATCCTPSSFPSE